MFISFSYSNFPKTFSMLSPSFWLAISLLPTPFLHSIVLFTCPSMDLHSPALSGHHIKLGIQDWEVDEYTDFITSRFKTSDTLEREAEINMMKFNWDKCKFLSLASKI